MEGSTASPRSEQRPSLSGFYHPLGYPVSVVTNCAAVLEAAEESWGAFQKLFSGDPIQLRIVVDEGTGNVPEAPPEYRSRSGVFSITADEANAAACDLMKGTGTARFAGGTVQNRAQFRYYFLDAMGYAMVDARMFTPVHAGCVALNGQGVLLCGDSGAGKSSLSYACARKGWTYVSDDASHLLRGKVTAVGFPHELRLREPARDLFPELRHRKTTRRATGKMSIEIRTAELPGIRTAPQAEIRHVVFLNRRPCPAQLQPYSKEDGFRRMAQVLTFAEGDLLEAHLAALRKLLTLDVLELSYEDLDMAVGQLLSLAERD